MTTRSFICDLGADGIHVDSLDDIHVTVAPAARRELISELRAGRTFKQAAFDAAFRYFDDRPGRTQVVVDVREDGSDRALEDLAHAIDGLRAYRDKGDLVAELARAIHAGGAVVEELYGMVGPRVALEWVNKKLDEGETHRGLRPFRARLLTAFPELADD